MSLLGHSQYYYSLYMFPEWALGSAPAFYLRLVKGSTAIHYISVKASTRKACGTVQSFRMVFPRLLTFDLPLHCNAPTEKDLLD